MKYSLRCLLAFVLILTGSIGTAASLNIANDGALRAALKQGVKNKVLVLAPGVYDPLVLRGDQVPAEIRSANPQNPAILRGLKISKFDGLRISGVVFGYAFNRADKLNVRPFSFADCKNLTLTGNRVQGELARGTGTLADGHGYGIGLSVRFCEDVAITSNHISRHHRGLIVSESDKVNITNNEVTAIRMDGMTFAQVTNVRIENNHIHSFKRVLKSKDHSDMIQFWTTSTKSASRNITIRGNLLNSGVGAFTQSIFMRNELVDMGRAGKEMYYRNLLIEQNVIINAHLHGITVGETAGLTIRNNTLVQNPKSAGGPSGDRVWLPTIRLSDASTDVAVQNNIQGDISKFKHHPGWQVSGNLVVVPSQYAKVFAGWPQGDTANPETFRLRPGVPSVGARRLQR